MDGWDLWELGLNCLCHPVLIADDQVDLIRVQSWNQFLHRTKELPVSLLVVRAMEEGCDWDAGLVLKDGVFDEEGGDEESIEFGRCLVRECDFISDNSRAQECVGVGDEMFLGNDDVGAMGEVESSDNFVRVTEGLFEQVAAVDVVFGQK
jgi:hypothetical protein